MFSVLPAVLQRRMAEFKLSCAKERKERHSAKQENGRGEEKVSEEKLKEKEGEKTIK